MNVKEKSHEERIGELEEAVQSVLLRNQRVELEKEWELSTARIISNVLLTYLLMCLVFYAIRAERVMINALIPTLGYYLSTQSLTVLKRRWIERKKGG